MASRDDEKPSDLHIGHQFMHQFEALWSGLDVDVGRACKIAAGSAKAVDKSRQYRIAPIAKTIGMVVVAGFSARAAGAVAATITLT